MKNRYKCYVLYFIAIILTCLFANDIYAAEKTIGKREAKKIIDEHIKYGYNGVLTGEKTIGMLETDLINRTREYYTILENQGLIKYRLLKLNMGLEFKFDVNLTEKGYNLVKAREEENEHYVAFVSGERKIFEIVKIDPSENLVYFSYGFEPNDLGYLLGGTKDEKNRGKAKIIYDIFLEEFVFKGFEYSKWEIVEWHAGSWAYGNNDKKIVKHGIIE